MATTAPSELDPNLLLPAAPSESESESLLSSLVYGSSLSLCLEFISLRYFFLKFRSSYLQFCILCNHYASNNLNLG